MVTVKKELIFRSPLLPAASGGIELRPPDVQKPSVQLPLAVPTEVGHALAGRDLGDGGLTEPTRVAVPVSVVLG